MDLWLCWSTPKALWIGDHLRKSLPSRGYPTTLKIFEIGNSEDQFATTIAIIIKIISMIILFIINIITFPNLWTPFSVASHLSHLNQTTVEAGHVFQTQTSEKYLVIFIIIPIQIIQWLVIWTYFARHVLQIQAYENYPKDMCSSKKSIRKCRFQEVRASKAGSAGRKSVLQGMLRKPLDFL